MSSEAGLPTDKLRNLYKTLVGAVGPLATREVLLAAAGLKTARLGLNDRRAGWLEQVLAAQGVASCRSTGRFTTHRDIGKGGWSNRFDRELPASNARGDWLVYVATSERVAVAARDAEAEQREGDFGATLGIPQCCAEFYLAHREIALRKQNDYVPLVLDNTRAPFPYNYWNNYVAQYFGYALISFFPCSFLCQRAAAIAQRTYEFLREICRHFADRFVYMQRQSILYTEYRGLFLFEGARYLKGFLDYDPARIHTTLRRAALMKPLLSGKRLRINAIHDIDILSGNAVLKSCRGDNVSACIFQPR
jgi:hypothetical protein